ncbi:MAG: 1-acyl-sn-glycerol-3-phosphate acyltransferase [Gammaproteobacteria bacterium]|nr:1-acyl-sn-glycerol-3-phosphate acyltransferase [Gammaproteobacteria bacterium]
MTSFWRSLRCLWRIISVFIQVLRGVHLVLFLLKNPPETRTPAEWRSINAWSKGACKRLGLRVHVSGTPATDSAMFLSNHISWLDIPVLQSLVSASFVSKAEVRQWPIIGWVAYHGGTLFVKRGKHDSFTELREALATRLIHKQGILLFPEGTTTNGDQVAPFKTRLLQPAADFGLVVQAVALQYRSSALPQKKLAFIGNDTFAKHAFRVFSVPIIDVYVHFGQVQQLDPQWDKRALAQYTRQWVADAHAVLQANITN